MPRVFLGICLGFTLALLSAAEAAPVRYLLDHAASRVDFEVDFGQSLITGQMPVAEADIALDFRRPSASTIRVTLDASRARTNLPFATGAMTGPSVLDARRHPTITFVSTGLTARGNTQAEVAGILTIRGVARPVVLTVDIFRDADTEPGDRRNLTVRLSGQVNRSEFGATGFPNMVDDEVRLIIFARIDRVE